MIKTCTYCGYVNATADDTSVLCPNCGMAYPAEADAIDSLPTVSLAPDHASPFTVPSGDYITPPPPLTSVPADRPPRAPQHQRSNGRPLLWGILVGVVVAALLGGGVVAFAAHGGSTPVAATSTATPTPMPTKTVAQIYIDPQGEFTLKYPAQWVVTPTSFTYGGGTVNATRFAPAHSGAGMWVMTSTHSLGYRDTGALIAQQGGTAYQVTSGPTALAAKSGQWQSITATYTAKGGAAARLFARSTQQSGVNYLVIGYGTAQEFAGTLSKELATIFASISLSAGA